MVSLSLSLVSLKSKTHMMALSFLGSGQKVSIQLDLEYTTQKPPSVSMNQKQNDIMQEGFIRCLKNVESSADNQTENKRDKRRKRSGEEPNEENLANYREQQPEVFYRCD
ncbi:unnamed protein product [Clonostachys rosea]|uniref:Uncharacterized protein n=1 Tax=Bionectria ochroleuca TaxID=29856 RepID=A0ABY6UFU1_BIOOC|nr:unnamed protein product [Clonostachys rosea]